jgi:hypothetical protein
MQFILTKDSLHASHIRKSLGRKGRVGIKVGSFNVLLDAMADLWLVPTPDDDWQHELHQQALQMPKAFWANSLQVDKIATLHGISQALLYLLDHCPLGQELECVGELEAKLRQGRYYNDLVNLFCAMNCIRPPQQALAQALFAELHATAIEPINLALQLDVDSMPVWQQQLVQALQSRYEINADLTRLAATLMPSIDMRLPIPSTMARLFSAEDNMGKPEGLELLSCRDVAEEADVIASVVQQAIDEGMAANDIAIICPHTGDYAPWLQSSLGKAGVACFGNEIVTQVVDWQVELIHDLLALCTVAPPMGLLSVLANPLMPWGRAQGIRYVRLNRTDIKWLAKVADEDQQLIALLLNPRSETGLQVQAWLAEIATHMKAEEHWGLTAQSMEQHMVALDQVFSLSAELGLSQQIANARAQFQGRTLPIQIASIRRLNCVTLVQERDSLPMQFKQVYVMGFNENNYEFTPRSSGPLMRAYLDCKTALGGVGFGTVKLERTAWQAQIKQLFSCASERLIFTLSRCNLFGEAIEPSATLMDLAAGFQQRKNLAPHQLIEARGQALGVNVASQQIRAIRKSSPKLRDLQFGGNIQSLITVLNGEPRAESPSSLDNLMLSPLAWLLARLNITSNAWEVLSLDVRTQGLAAHRAFELYDKHKDDAWTQKLCEQLIEQGIIDEAAFLQQPQWQLEKQVLTQEISSALNSFVQWSQTSGWRVQKVEQKLNGHMWEWPIKGFADAILEHPNYDGVMILDYKKSKHKARIDRLNGGYDLQTTIYRSLLDQQGQSVAYTGYYTMNDQTFILDEISQGMDAPGITLLTSKLEHRVQQSQQATHAIAERFNQIHRGEIQLNQAGDVKEWKKKGITVYSLEDNALVKRFVKPALEDHS